MQHKKDISLAVLFTRGMSFALWKKSGFLQREVTLYTKIAASIQDITFFTYGLADDSNHVVLNTNMQVIPMQKRMNSWLYSLLMPVLQKKSFETVDLIKTNQMEGAWTAILAKWLYKKPVVLRCGYEWFRFAIQQGKGGLHTFVKYYIEKFCYTCADHIIVTSESDKKFVQEKFNIKPEKITVVPNYIDTQLFAPQQVEKNQKNIVTVARLSTQKNLQNLIAAVDGLDIELDIYGSGELEDSLKEFAKDISVARINFKGRVENTRLPEIINAASLFVLPSLYEGNPKTLLEAMACGAAVIGTDVAGIREVIDTGKTGVLCDTDVSSIRSAIEKLLADNTLKNDLGTQARAYIEKNYTLDKIVKTELAVYESVIAK